MPLILDRLFLLIHLVTAKRISVDISIFALFLLQYSYKTRNHQSLDTHINDMTNKTMSNIFACIGLNIKLEGINNIDDIFKTIVHDVSIYVSVIIINVNI